MMLALANGAARVLLAMVWLLHLLPLGTGRCTGQQLVEDQHY